jgi:hypothetical protein
MPTKPALPASARHCGTIWGGELLVEWDEPVWEHDLANHQANAVSLTPGWLRSEIMLDQFGVTEDNWRPRSPKRPASSAAPSRH